MIPSKRLIILILFAAPFFLAGSIIGAFTAYGILYLAVVIFTAIVDFSLYPRQRSIVMKRIIPERFSLNVPSKVAIEVENHSGRTAVMEIAERLPDDMEIVEKPHFLRIHNRRRGIIEYSLKANKRGKYLLSEIDIRLYSGIGLLIRQFQKKLPAEVQVFPNLVNLKKTDLQTRKGLSLEHGFAYVRQLGQGYEFESLRPYSSGDDIGRIDWKATAKRSELVMRNYQPERQQNVLVAIDVGRATAGEFENMSRLDYLVNATLMLAFDVLRQGDLFSLVAFSDNIESYLPPVRGVKNIDKVARALYELTPRLVEADYAGACTFLGLKSRKRSLICVMTDVIDRQASDDILAYMARFARRHLPIIVTLTDTDVKQLAEESLIDMKNPYSKAVAIDVVKARNEALGLMRQSGVIVLDVPPKELTTSLIHTYLQIKASRRL